MVKKPAKKSRGTVARVKPRKKRNRRMFPGGLTPVQFRFVNFLYSTGLNVRKAAELAGCKYPDIDGYKLKKIPRVIDAMEKRAEEIKSESAEDVRFLLAFLWECIYVTVADVAAISGDGFEMFNLSEQPRSVQIMVKSVGQRKGNFGSTWNVTMHDFTKVIELWARLKGLLPNDKEGGPTPEVIRQIIERTINGDRDDAAGIPAHAD